MPHAKSMPSVLFVCTGNICRSPTAHALLLHKAAEQNLSVEVDSAAVSGEELGHPPDRRAVAELRRRGVAMPSHRARIVTAADFDRFDLVIGMTADHVRALRHMASSNAAKIERLMHYAGNGEAVNVPDPWFGDAQDFIHAFDMIEAGVDGLLRQYVHTSAGWLNE